MKLIFNIVQKYYERNFIPNLLILILNLLSIKIAVLFLKCIVFHVNNRAISGVLLVRLNVN